MRLDLRMSFSNTGMYLSYDEVEDAYECKSLAVGKQAGAGLASLSRTAA